MKKIFYLTIVALFIAVSSKFYSQTQFQDEFIHYPILLDKQSASESTKPLRSSQELDSLINLTMQTYHLPGLSALIVKHDSIVWSNNYGYSNIALNIPVEDSTLFLMASISKTIMMTALMQLWENGLFDLEDNINDYLQPDFQIHNPYHPNETITFKMIMTHTSSIDDNWSILTPLEQCGDSPISLDYFLANYFNPGGNYYNSNNFLNQLPSDTVWEYTNAGSSILAFVVEKLSGVSFAQYCSDSIFIPLDMDLTSWFLEGMDTSDIAIPYEWTGSQYHANCHQGWPPYPAAFLRTNKVELGHFLSAYMNEGAYNGYQLLNSSTIDTMLRVYKYVPSEPLHDWGLIWFRTILNNLPMWGHTGGWTAGTNTSLQFHPAEDWGYVMFYNRYDATAFWILNTILSNYSHLYGNIYALNTHLNKTYMRPSVDTLIVRTEFSNLYQHNFSANAVVIRSDGAVIDSTMLYDDGLHADSLANDGIWGGIINPIIEEEIYQVGISTLDVQNGDYFITKDLAGFTTAGPVIVDSITITYNPLVKIYLIKPYLKNEGQSFTIEDISISILTEDSSVSILTGTLNLSSLAPGETLPPNGTFYIRVDSSFTGILDFDFEIKSGGWTYWIDSTQIIITGTEERQQQVITYILQQNYPNPFNPATKIKFQIPSVSLVTLKIYDVLGRVVKTLIHEERAAGTYETEFDASSLSSGIYFYQLKAGDFVDSKKMVLIK